MGTDILQQLAIRLKPLTREVNNINYFIRMAPTKGWDILVSKRTVSSRS